MEAKVEDGITVVKVEDDPTVCLKGPPKKRLKKNAFTLNEKEMIVNVYKYVKESQTPQQTKNNCNLHMKTAKILGVGIASVYRILKEHANDAEMKAPVETKKRPLFSDKIGESEKSAIRRKVYSFFETDEIPSGKKVLKAVNEDEILPTFRRTTFHKILRHLKFKYIRRRGKNAVLDTDEMVIWRRDYLDKIIQYRKKGRPIYYVDETWINVEETASKTLNINAKIKLAPKDIKRLNVVHIGNENGFVPNASELFDSTAKNNEDLMTAEHFEWWFENTMTKLEENAIVVMDAAPYHSRRIDKIPSSTWTKANIQEWLRKRDIQFNDDEIKAELLDKVYKLKLKRRTYAVDEIAKKYNVEVLRIPPFHYELSPMVSVMAEVKQYVTSSFKTIGDAEKFLREDMEKLYAEKWPFHIERAKQEECYYYRIDDIIDDVMDKVYDGDISFSDSSEESDSNSDGD